MQMTKGAFTRWLAGSVLVSLDRGAATVQAHDSYAVQWRSTRSLMPIQRTLAGIVGHDVAVTFTTSPGASGRRERQQQKAGIVRETLQEWSLAAVFA